MKFDEALMRFKNEILKEYGSEGLIKIGVDYDLFNIIILDFSKDGRATYYPADCNKTMICGVEIKVTEKDRF